MNRVSFSTHKWLLPLSWLYGLVVSVRNELFDAGWLKSERFPIPVIGMGNITVGGTGKTPHTEYLIRLLSREWRVAVLSRGYGRSSHGYVLAAEGMPPSMIGDEPWQIKKKFPNVHVAVDVNRCRGIQRLMSDKETRDVDVILLDDSFQHRFVSPGLNMLLVNWHRPIYDDCLLPAGRLRESAKGKGRADVVVVSKCPDTIRPMDMREVYARLNLLPSQKLFFSGFSYGMPRPLFVESGETEMTWQTLKGQNVLLVTGIGNPTQMKGEVKPLVRHLETLTFPDHHRYTASNIRWINRRLERMQEPRIVMTTEKDAARMLEICGYDGSAFHKAIYVLPAEIRILQNRQEAFNKYITDYVRKNIRNHSMAED